MTKSELVRRIVERSPHLYQRDVERIVSAILAEVTAALERGDRVELRGFGIFSIKLRQARLAKNPRTGQCIQVDEKRFPLFKASKEMRERLNRDARQETGASVEESQNKRTAYNEGQQS